MTMGGYSQPGCSSSPRTLNPLSTDVRTDMLSLLYTLELRGDSASLDVKLYTASYSSSDRFVITSGSSLPLEFKQTSIRFNFIEGDTIQIALLRSSTEFPDLIDAPNTIVTPPPLLQLEGVPPSGTIDPTNIVNLSWQPQGYTFFEVSEYWHCTQDSIPFNQEVQANTYAFPGPTYQLDVAARLADFSAKTGTDKFECTAVEVQLEGWLLVSKTHMDPNLFMGKMQIIRIETINLTLPP